MENGMMTGMWLCTSYLLPWMLRPRRIACSRGPVTASDSDRMSIFVTPCAALGA